MRCTECLKFVGEQDLNCDYCNTPTMLGRVQCSKAVLDTMRDSSGEDRTEQLTDLLANLMHFCRAERVSFDRCLSSALMHYECEK